MRLGDEPVVLAEPDAAWPDWYAEEAARLRRGLPSDVVALEHIGSTAVPGLRSKPIVDLLIGLRDFDDAEAVGAELARLGYEDCGGVPDRRYFRRRGERSFNAHIVEHDGRLWRANLVFRDYLREHPEAARAYAAVKDDALRTAEMSLAYSEAKAAGLGDLLDRARRWADGRTEERGQAPPT